MNKFSVTVRHLWMLGLVFLGLLTLGVIAGFASGSGGENVTEESMVTD